MADFSSFMQGLGSAVKTGFVDSMSRPQLISFLSRKGFHRPYLTTPQGLRDAKEAHKMGFSGQVWSRSYGMSGNTAGIRPTSRTFPGASRTFDIESYSRPAPALNRAAAQDAPRRAGGGVPGIGNIMSQIMSMYGSGGGGAAPTFNAPQAPDFAGLFKGLKLPKFNPREIQNLIKSAYAPLLGALGSQMQASRMQGAQNLADIEGWYNQIQGTAAAGTAADAAAGQAAQATYGSAVEGFLGAVGGGASPAAADIAKAGASGAAGLAGIAQAQSNFNRNLETLIPLAEADAARREQGRASQEAFGIFQEMQRARGEQKSDIMKAVFEGKQQNYANKLNLITTKAGLSQQAFQNALQIAEMDYNARAAAMGESSAPDPIDLIKSAIDIQAGLLANRKAMRGAGDSRTAVERELDRIKIARENIGLAQDIQALSGEDSDISRTDYTAYNTALEDAIGYGTKAPVTDPSAVVRIVVSTLRQLNLDPYVGEGRRIRLAFLRRFFRLNSKGLPIGEFGDIGGR